MDLRPSSRQATIVRLDQALRITFFGLDMKVLLTTEATGGAISVLMGSHRPGDGRLLEGTYELTVDGQIATAGGGTIVFIPRNVVHRFENVGDTTACMLDWSLAGGQDHYFKAMAARPAGDCFTGDRMMAISRKFDTNFPAPQRRSYHLNR